MDIAGYIRGGGREDIPADCPQKFANIIQICWSQQPINRPSADEILANLNGINLGDKFEENKQEEEFKSMDKKLENEKPEISQNEQEKRNEISKVNLQDVQTFLELVTWGQQPKAEEILKKKQELALAKGAVTDPAKRTFKDISGFQYAVWALDWHMWNMIRKYLPLESAIEQAKKFGTGSWLNEYKVHAGWAIKKVIDVQHGLGGKTFQNWVYQLEAQLLLPIHVLQEYSSRDFNNFAESSNLNRELKDFKGWLQKGHKKESAIVRGIFETITYANDHNFDIYGFNSACEDGIFCQDTTEVAQEDRKVLVKLFKIRNEQRNQLVAELVGGNIFSQKFSFSPQLNTAKIQQFLDLVTWVNSLKQRRS